MGMHEQIHAKHQQEMASTLEDMKTHEGSMAEMESYVKKILREKDAEIEELQYTIADNKEAIEKHQAEFKSKVAAFSDLQGTLSDSQNAHSGKDAQIAELVRYKRNAEMQIVRHEKEKEF